MYRSSEVNFFILKYSLSLPPSSSLSLRDLTSHCQSCGCSFGRVAALHAERDRCVGAGQRCGKAVGGNLIAGPEGTGRGTTLNFILK